MYDSPLTLPLHCAVHVLTHFETNALCKHRVPFGMDIQALSDHHLAPPLVSVMTRFNSGTAIVFGAGSQSCLVPYVVIKFSAIFTNAAGGSTLDCW